MTLEDFKDNKEACRVIEVVNNTNDSVFMTGRAGSGKSTLLKTILATSKKRIIVTAPTGIAAKNVGGVTLHSLFKIPLGINFSTDRQIQDIFYLEDRVTIIQQMQVLVIDEISMVPSYLLDCIDYLLQSVRGNKMPFGGVQLFLIGDPFQLPPVIKPTEKEILATRYESEMFFDSLALRQVNFHKIELKINYRQKDQEFLSFLDRVRVKDVSLKELTTFNKKCIRDFNFKEGDFSIVITPTNKKAEEINNREFNKLTTPIHYFKGIVEGSFNVWDCIAKETLMVREGMHVMFVKNNFKAGYYNGTLGIVKYVDSITREIIVKTEEGKEIHALPEKWEEYEYHYNQDSGQFEKDIIGSMTQFALIPSWCVTSHKTQGLTFNEISVDPGFGFFAPGQAYVTLSRCRTLEGIHLKSRIMYKDIIVSSRIKEFYKELELA